MTWSIRVSKLKVLTEQGTSKLYWAVVAQYINHECGGALTNWTDCSYLHWLKWSASSHTVTIVISAQCCVSASYNRWLADLTFRRMNRYVVLAHPSSLSETDCGRGRERDRPPIKLFTTKTDWLIGVCSTRNPCLFFICIHVLRDTPELYPVSSDLHTSCLNHGNVRLVEAQKRAEIQCTGDLTLILWCVDI